MIEAMKRNPRSIKTATIPATIMTIFTTRHILHRPSKDARVTSGLRTLHYVYTYRSLVAD
jgi:hypothetical protein